MKKLTAVLTALLMVFALLIPASLAESGEEEEEAIDRYTLMKDLAAARKAEDRVLEDLAALEGDRAAAAAAEVWQRIYMDDGWRVYVSGKDDPAELQVAGKHAFAVLGFELQDGEMAEELKARCEAAAEAARCFPDSLLVCSGGATGENNPEGHTEAGMMKEYLVRECGIAAERILTDERAMTTLDNAVNTFEILREQGIEAITVVTSAYHQKRANVLYAAMAEILRQTEGFSVSVIGNYSCDYPGDPALIKHDPEIASAQLSELLGRLAPVEETEDEGEGTEEAEANE